MSVRLLAWAFEQALPCAEKLVLVALADMADMEGKCWPTQACLAKRCGIARETVNRIIGKLAEAELIRVEHRVSACGKRASLCFMRCDAGSHPDVTYDHIPPPFSSGCDAGSHSGNLELFAKSEDSRDVIVDHIEPSIDKKESKKPPSSAPPITSEAMHHAPSGASGNISPSEEKSHARGSRLPPGWQPSPADREFAETRGLDPAEIAAEFADYWRPLTGPKATKLDWSATYRNWCRRERNPRGDRSEPLSIAAALSRVRLAGDDEGFH